MAHRRRSSPAAEPATAQPASPRLLPRLEPPADDAAADPLDDVVARVRRATAESERLFGQLIAGERRFRGLARAVWQVQEEERRRLARELHDGIGQTLTAVKNQLALLTARAAAEAPGLAAELGAAFAATDQALQETRELSRLLRPPILDDLGLEPALRWLRRTLGERAGLTVELAVENLDEATRLAPDLETLVFRVAQEALTNVVRHAGVDTARLTVRRSDERLRLEVADCGRGFEPAEAASRDGIGLRGMRDRVELFGGRLDVRSAPGRGTTVAVELPLAEAGDETAAEGAAR